MNADVPGSGVPPGDDPEDGQLSDADQSLSDGEQTLSDLDQTQSDEDRELSDLDQASSDLDQHASDRDQATADRDEDDRTEGGAGDPWAAARYATSRADRLSGTLARFATSVDRVGVIERRDSVAAQRDRTADARDEAAAARDRLAARRDAQLTVTGKVDEALVDLLASARMRAGMDRERAARDRRSAAMDRVHAARDRQFAREALRHAHHDALTGALNRELGEPALQAELDRARRHGAPFTLACVTVDGLSAVNRAEGRVAGDAVLVSVTSNMRRHLRPVDTIMRFGGGEFVCGLPQTTRAEANRTFAAITESLTAEHNQAISVGTAEPEPDDTLSDLVERADAALYAARRQRDA